MRRKITSYIVKKRSNACNYFVVTYFQGCSYNFGLPILKITISSLADEDALIFINRYKLL